MGFYNGISQNYICITGRGFRIIDIYTELHGAKKQKGARFLV